MPYRVLFVCTANAGRSQIAEALLNALGGGRFAAASAGAQPGARVNALAVQVLQEHGIAWGGRAPRSVDAVRGEQWDAVITVCDHARESCPVFPGQPVVAHWGMADPNTLEEFQTTYDALHRRLRRLVALPLDDLDPAERAAAIDAIGTA